MINIGVIGCGYWGPNLIRNFSQIKGCNMHSCSDLREERLAHMKELYPNLSTTKNYKEIIENPEIDAVVIATPVSTHHNIAKEALENGKHVLIEKPITKTSAEAKEIIDFAKKRNKVLMVDHTFEYNSAVRKIKEIIEKGELGNIYTIDMVRVNLGLFQKDINVVEDLLPHDASILRYLLGENPEKVETIAEAYVQKGIEDSAYINLRFKNKTMANIHVSWLDPCKIRRTTIVGSKKMLVYDDLEPNEKIKIYDKGVSVENAREAGSKYYDTFTEFQYLYRSGEVYSPKIEANEPLRNVCAHFVECIKDSKMPLTDGVSGLMAVKVVEAALESLRNNGKEVFVGND